MLSVLGFVLMVTAPDGVAPSLWLGHDAVARACVEALMARARGDAGERGPNAVALAAWLLDGALLSPPCSQNVLSITFGPDGRAIPSAASGESTWLFARVAAGALQHLSGHSDEERDLLERVVGYREQIGMFQFRWRRSGPPSESRSSRSAGRSCRPTPASSVARHRVRSHVGCVALQIALLRPEPLLEFRKIAAQLREGLERVAHLRNLRGDAPMQSDSHLTPCAQIVISRA